MQVKMYFISDDNGITWGQKERLSSAIKPDHPKFGTQKACFFGGSICQTTDGYIYALISRAADLFKNAERFKHSYPYDWSESYIRRATPQFDNQ